MTTATSTTDTTDSTANSASTPSVAGKVGKYRWYICALLFFCTTINYVDRTSLAVLKTTLEAKLGWTDVDYGWVMFAFTAAYAAFPSIAGNLIDRFGVKASLAGALILWSLMAGLHAVVGSVLGFAVVRFFLGAAEAANFPASIKAVALWFPQKERALAVGVFNSGTNVGVMVSAVTVWLAGRLGWQWAFVAVGAIGLVWLAFWQAGFDAPRASKKVGAAELAYIETERGASADSLKVHWTALLRYRQIWPFLIAKLLTDPVWWFYLYWLPSYFAKERGQDALKSAGLLAVIYTGASVGSIVGGWLSGSLMGRGWGAGAARLGAMLLPAVFMPGAILAYYTHNFTLCVAFVTLATACHQAWSANLFTTATDLFPAKVSGSVVGLGATSGGIGGMFMTLLAAMVIQWTGNQQIIFIWAGLMHPVSWLILRFWLGKDFKRVELDRLPDLSKSFAPLLIAGAAVVAIGLSAAFAIVRNWQLCVAAVRLPGAAQAITAASGVVLLGAALLYAGSSRRSALASGS
jgi:ACS family hexuronate transporter-like MFS transporter